MGPWLEAAGPECGLPAEGGWGGVESWRWVIGVLRGLGWLVSGAGRGVLLAVRLCLEAVRGSGAPRLRALWRGCIRSAAQGQKGMVPAGERGIP